MVTSSTSRTARPTRDWIIEDDFDFAMANYWLEEPRFGEQYRSAIDNARMFCWLCGKGDAFEKAPGVAWPFPRVVPWRCYGAGPPEEIDSMGAQFERADPVLQ